MLTAKQTAQAVSRKDNLEFLEDLIPKTVPYKDVKARAATTRAMVEGGGKIKNGDSTGTTGADDAPKAGQASSAEASTSRQRENQATMRDMLLRQGGESRRSVTNGGDSSSAVNGHGHHHSSRPSGSFGGGRSGLLNAANGNSSNGTAAAENDESGDPSAQLQLESEAMNDRQAGRRGRRQDQDVEMTG